MEFSDRKNAYPAMPCPRALPRLTAFLLMMGSFGAFAAGGTHGQNPFVEAMRVMADAVSKAGRDTTPGQSQHYSGYSWPYNPQMQPMTGVPGGMMMPGFNPGWPGMAMPLAPASPLEGTWTSPAGDRFVARGTRYRLISAQGRQTEGNLEVEDRYVQLIDDQTGRRQRYEYAVKDNRLVLRHSSGQLLLYVRMEGDGSAGRTLHAPPYRR